MFGRVGLEAANPRTKRGHSFRRTRLSTFYSPSLGVTGTRPVNLESWTSLEWAPSWTTLQWAGVTERIRALQDGIASTVIRELGTRRSNCLLSGLPCSSLPSDQRGMLMSGHGFLEKEKSQGVSLARAELVAASVNTRQWNKAFTLSRLSPPTMTSSLHVNSSPCPWPRRLLCHQATVDQGKHTYSVQCQAMRPGLHTHPN